MVVCVFVSDRERETDSPSGLSTSSLLKLWYVPIFMVP